MDTSITLGRQNLNIGQGLIWWDNPVDGIMVTQDLGNNSLISAGWEKFNCGKLERLFYECFYC